MIRNEVQQFEREAWNHGNALEEGDFKLANRAYSKIHNSYLSLKAHHRVSELEILLVHDSQYVRLWSATYLLQTATDQSVKVLEELGTFKGSSAAFDARITLSEWVQGHLKF